jgi:hypothetical protein
VTPELHQHWRTGTTPFDGTVVATYDDPTLTDVLDIMRIAVEGLRHDEGEIWIYSDWHEHDGFMTSPKQISWNEFATRLSNPKTLYDSRDSDEYVRIGLYPASFSWLLRYNIDDNDKEFINAWCSLDFACTPGAPAFKVINEINLRWPGFTDLLPAKEFFDNSYGG